MRMGVWVWLGEGGEATGETLWGSPGGQGEGGIGEGGGWEGGGEKWEGILGERGILVIIEERRGLGFDKWQRDGEEEREGDEKKLDALYYAYFMSLLFYLVHGFED